MSGPITTLSLPTTAPPVSRRPALLLLGLAAASLALTFVALALGAPTWPWLLAAVAVSAGLLAADRLAVLRGQHGVLRLRVEDGGVVVVGSPWSRVVDLLVAPVLLVGLGGAAAAYADVSSTSGSVTVVPLVVLAVLLAVAALRLVRIIVLQRRASRLRLDREGVEPSGTSGRGTFPWELVEGVRREGDRLTLLAPGGPPVVLPSDELRSDPELVARLVEHYLRHRRDREELGDERVLQRVREDRLDAPGR